MTSTHTNWAPLGALPKIAVSGECDIFPLQDNIIYIFPYNFQSPYRSKMSIILPSNISDSVDDR